MKRKNEKEGEGGRRGKGKRGRKSKLSLEEREIYRRGSLMVKNEEQGLDDTHFEKG